MTEEESRQMAALYAAMEQSPDDFTVRSVLADWCADHDLPDWEEYLRWTCEEKKRPRHLCMGGYYEGWQWFDENRNGRILIDIESDLPSNIYSLLEPTNTNDYRIYPTMFDADASVVSARHRLAGSTK